MPIITNNKWVSFIIQISRTNLKNCNYKNEEVQHINHKFGLCTELKESFKNIDLKNISQQDVDFIDKKAIQLFTRHPDKRFCDLISEKDILNNENVQYLNHKGYIIPKYTDCFKYSEKYSIQSKLFVENHSVELTNFLLKHTIDSSNNLILDNFQNILY